MYFQPSTDCLQFPPVRVCAPSGEKAAPHVIGIFALSPRKMTFPSCSVGGPSLADTVQGMAQPCRAVEGANVFLFYSRYLVCPVVSLSSFPQLVLNLYFSSFFSFACPYCFFPAATCGGLGEQYCRNTKLLREYKSQAALSPFCFLIR